MTPQRYSAKTVISSDQLTRTSAPICALGEGPLWSLEEQCLYFVDINGFQVHRFDPYTETHRSYTAPEEPACLALMESGRLMVALRSGFATLNTQSGDWGSIIAADFDTQQFRFNDGRTDGAGRFWAGTMFQPRSSNAAALYCLERGVIRKVLGPETGQGVKTSNGLAFDAKHHWMYHSDTPNHIVRRYPYDAKTGVLGDASVFTLMLDNRPDPSYGGRPDGAAIDNEGCYWSAQYEGGRVLRFNPDGQVILEIQVPAKRPTMVAFGGNDLRTLFITSAKDGVSESELLQFPHSGGLFSLDLRKIGLSCTGYASTPYLE